MCYGGWATPLLFCDEQNGGYYNNHTTSHDDDAMQLLERDNDAAIAQLQAKVRRIRDVSVEINAEVTRQNKELDKNVSCVDGQPFVLYIQAHGTGCCCSVAHSLFVMLAGVGCMGRCSHNRTLIWRT